MTKPRAKFESEVTQSLLSQNLAFAQENRALLQELKKANDTIFAMQREKIAEASGAPKLDRPKARI